jgi:hypothetical protein
VAYITNSLWYSNYRVCGDFALEILSSLPPLDTNKKSMGGGGGLSLRDNYYYI